MTFRERFWDLGILCAMRSRMMTSRVFRLDEKRVLKWIHTPTEALTMIFIAQNTSIPVPRVQAVRRYKDKYALIMDYVRASERTWSKLSASDRANVAEQLAGYVSQLRQLVPPRPGRVEAVDGTPCTDPKLNIALEPCTIDEFHLRLGHEHVRTCGEDSWHYPLRRDFERIHGRQYRTTFCHADLTWHNILIRRGKIVAILDWQSGGWYPEYLEYTRLNLIWSFVDPSFWDLLKPHLDPYEDELRADKSLGTAFSIYT